MKHGSTQTLRASFVLMKSARAALDALSWSVSEKEFSDLSSTKSTYDKIPQSTAIDYEDKIPF